MGKTTIEWTDYSWNPVSGCEHGCPYCYAREIVNRFPANYPNGFKPHFYPERLAIPKRRKKPTKYFVTDMGDQFGDWVPREWWEQIFTTVKDCPQHTFQFLTKNPKRLKELNPFPDNCWVGVTATNQKIWNSAILHLGNVDAKVKFISAEPLLEEITIKENPGIDWLIIGALSKGQVKIQPPKGVVDNLIAEARKYGIAVFTKDNLYGYNLREYPIVAAKQHYIL